MGCMPVAVLTAENPEPGFFDEIGCVKNQNEMAMEFNKLLKNAVIRLRSKLRKASLIYVDMYKAKYELISNAHREGTKFFFPRKWIDLYYKQKDMYKAITIHVFGVSPTLSVLSLFTKSLSDQSSTELSKTTLFLLFQILWVEIYQPRFNKTRTPSLWDLIKSNKLPKEFSKEHPLQIQPSIL